MDKKKPGRPKKTISGTPQQSYGCVGTPANPDHIMELVYFNPQLYKKIFALMKSYDVSDVEMHFFPEYTMIVAIDHLKKSHIYVRVEGRRLELYYCKEYIRISLKLQSLEKVIATINKCHNKITMVLKENYRSTLYCMLKDAEFNVDEIYEVDVILKTEYLPHEPPDDSAYPIRFKLNSKHFKRKINDIRKMSTCFNIQKIGTLPLHFALEKSTQKITYVGEYNDDAKIELKNTLAPDDIISVAVVIDCIKPFSNTCVGEEVWISVDKTRPITFLSKLDKIGEEYTCSIKVFTDIKNGV